MVRKVMLEVLKMAHFVYEYAYTGGFMIWHPLSGTLNHDMYVFVHKYLGQAYFPVSVGAEK